MSNEILVIDDNSDIRQLISGILKDDSSSFLRWVNDQVSVESFQVKTPSLEQIFIEEVRAAS